MAPLALQVQQAGDNAAPKSLKPNAHVAVNGRIKYGAEAPGVSVGDNAASLLDPLYKIIEQPVGTRRPIRVACLGAGYSGLMMGIVFSQKMRDKNAELVIYERNSDLGGTWFENR
jgi:hypothetical protein